MEVSVVGEEEAGNKGRMKRKGKKNEGKMVV